MTPTQRTEIFKLNTDGGGDTTIKRKTKIFVLNPQNPEIEEGDLKSVKDDGNEGEEKARKNLETVLEDAKKRYPYLKK
ncbi:MAG: hypothetical protein WCS86_03030 [Candidatus Paceibacterota bacterium]